MSPNEVLTEFKRKYEGTYVFVQMPDSEEENLFFMEAVNAHPTSIGVMALTSEEYGKIQLNLGTAHTIKFKFPKVGVYQHGADALVILREPRRQWRRGLCSDNCTIVYAHQKLYNHLLPGMRFPVVFSAFEGKQFSYVEALKMLSGDKYRSVALVDDFVLMLNMHEKGKSAYTVLYRTNPVATVAEDGELVQLLEPSFDQQLKRIMPQ